MAACCAPIADIGIAPPTINSPPIPEIIRQSKVHAIGATAMVEVRPDPFRLQRNVILVMLLAFAAAAWAVIVWRALNGMDMTMAPSAMGVRIALFVAMSAVMMMAMMFPSATPAILAYHKVQAGKQKSDDAFVLTWVFVAAYLLVWWAFAIYAGAMAAGVSGVRTDHATEIGGVILMLAGLYQLTPLREFCLSKCRTPIDFIAIAGSDGATGAFYMGIVHGLYCLGCCWMLFLALFPLGMSMVAMAAITLVILAEKTLPGPRIVTYATAVVLVLSGALMSVTPQFFPTVGEDSSATMPADMPMKMPGTAPAMK
jgi:predicted metal-binding membrane protein